VIRHVSDKERAQFGHWIDQALAETPQAFSQVAQQIGALKAERAALEADLARVPADEVLAPLVERHHALLRQLGGLEQRQEQLQAEEHSLVYSLAQNDFAQRRARAALEQSAATVRRVELIARTQRALDDYKAALTQRKVALLEQSLVSHFNQLCRKQAFVDRISVDLGAPLTEPRPSGRHAPLPDGRGSVGKAGTFAFTLHRAGHTFGREQLSAGENQLLAVATLWALRELSGRATPVLIDTPLSRLDSQHRHGMLHDFLPRASHQVILLATDAKIDAAAMKRLAPVIARVYRMEYDPATGAATHTAETPQVVLPNLTLFEEGLQRIQTGTDRARQQRRGA
jgi:DNA sulfur modification protein DndD